MTTQRGSIVTPWGWLTLEIGPGGLRRVLFDEAGHPPLDGPWAAALDGYLRGETFPADLPLDLGGVPVFTQRVLQTCRTVPFGTVCTYAQLAARLGIPRAARAVGQALARNPLPVVIPCHRVVGSDGALTGFLGGLAWKRALLRHEGLPLARTPDGGYRIIIAR